MVPEELAEFLSVCLIFDSSSKWWVAPLILPRSTYCIFKLCQCPSPPLWGLVWPWRQGRAGSNGTPEGWLIFGGGLNKWIIGWVRGWVDAWMRELFFLPLSSEGTGWTGWVMAGRERQLTVLTHRPTRTQTIACRILVTVAHWNLAQSRPGHPGRFCLEDLVSRSSA